MSRKVNESQKKEILNLFINGTNIKEISKIYNFTVPTITRQLKILVGNEEFNNLKKSNIDASNSNKNKLKSNSLKINNEINNLDQITEEKKSNQDSFFVELTPIDYEIDNTKQKDLSSIELSEINLPKVVYMIVNQKIELETKLLKEYPEWQFLSQEDLNRNTIKIYFDLKSAKNDCNKEQKVIKVPNTNVFKIVSPILVSRGISRIVSSDQLIAL